MDRLTEEMTVALAGRSSRRLFLSRVGTGFVALLGGPLVAVALSPERAEAHHICGHLYTTNSCPHPYAPLSRLDKAGYPLHPTYGYPVDDKGNIYTSTDQVRRKVCQEVVRKKYPFTGRARYGGGWARCCHGRIRRIVDCCSKSDTRINGDASVTGYCYQNTKVFCIAYRETDTTCKAT